MRYRAYKKVSRWRWRQRRRKRRRRRQQDPHQKQYVPLSFGGGHKNTQTIISCHVFLYICNAWIIQKSAISLLFLVYSCKFNALVEKKCFFFFLFFFFDLQIFVPFWR